MKRECTQALRNTGQRASAAHGTLEPAGQYRDRCGHDEGEEGTTDPGGVPSKDNSWQLISPTLFSHLDTDLRQRYKNGIALKLGFLLNNR